MEPDESDCIENDDSPDTDPGKDAIPRIEYLYASKGNEFMLDNELFENEGVTFDLWKKKEGEEEEEENQDEEEGEKKPSILLYILRKRN